MEPLQLQPYGVQLPKDLHDLANLLCVEVGGASQPLEAELAVEEAGAF